MAPDLEPATIAQLKANLLAAGYDNDVAIALSENGHTVETASHLSLQECFDLYLTWEGIIGFTCPILEVLKSLQRSKPEWASQVVA